VGISLGRGDLKAGARLPPLGGASASWSNGMAKLKYTYYWE